MPNKPKEGGTKQGGTPKGVTPPNWNSDPKFLANRGRLRDPENQRKAHEAAARKRKRDLLMRDLLDLALRETVETKDGKKRTKKEISARSLANEMASGDIKAIELGVRILGEFETKVTLTGDGVTVVVKDEEQKAAIENIDELGI